MLQSELPEPTPGATQLLAGRLSGPIPVPTLGSKSFFQVILLYTYFEAVYLIFLHSIRSVAYNSKTWDVTASNQADLTAIINYPFHGGVNQQFTLSRVGC